MYYFRPITSPVRPSGIPVLVSPPSKPTAKKIISPQGNKHVITLKGPSSVKYSPTKKVGTRTSRVDQVESNHDVQRPSSLPYKPVSQNSKTSKIVPQRRAASSSLSRRPVSGRSITPK